MNTAGVFLSRSAASGQRLLYTEYVPLVSIAMFMFAIRRYLLLSIAKNDDIKTKIKSETRNLFNDICRTE